MASSRTSTSWANTETPKHISVPAHGASVVTCLQLSGDRIITASDDHTILIHSISTCELLLKLEGHQGGVWSMDIFQGILVTGSTDRTVRVWDMSTGRCLHVFGGHLGTVRALSISKPQMVEIERDGDVVREEWPKHPLMVTGSRDRSLRVWRLPGPGDAEFKCFSDEQQVDDRGLYPDTDANDNPYHLHHLEGHDGVIRDLDVQGRIAVSGSYDNAVRVWDIVTGTCTLVLSGHTDKVYAVRLDLERKQVYSASMDHAVRIWDLQTGECRHFLTQHMSLVGLLAFSQSYLVSAAADGDLRVWNPATGELYHRLSTGSAITTFQHDEVKVVSGSGSGIRLWDIQSGDLVRDLLTDVTGVWKVAFSGRWCVAAKNVDDVTYIDTWDFGEESEDLTGLGSGSSDLDKKNIVTRGEEAKTAG